MRYIPFSSELNTTPNIMVDSGRTDATVLELSHWPGNRTPAEWKADTSTESVIKFLNSSQAEKFLTECGAVSVSNDHYDIDGLLSVWAILNPREALAHGTLLIDAAASGDFDIYTTDSAAKVCIVLNAFEERCLQPFFAECAWSGEDVTTFIYRRLLGLVGELLHDFERFEHIWKKELDFIQRSRELIQKGRPRIVEIAQLDFVGIETDEPLHRFAVHEAFSASRVAYSFANRHQFYYRYESFVDFVTREVAARIPLDALTARLNEREKAEGTWYTEAVTVAHPCLQLYQPLCVPAASALTSKEFFESITDYLTANAALAVSRLGEEWHKAVHILPPSYKYRTASKISDVA